MSKVFALHFIAKNFNCFNLRKWLWWLVKWYFIGWKCIRNTNWQFQGKIIIIVTKWKMCNVISCLAVIAMIVVWALSRKCRLSIEHHIIFISWASVPWLSVSDAIIACCYLLIKSVSYQVILVCLCGIPVSLCASV